MTTMVQTPDVIDPLQQDSLFPKKFEGRHSGHDNLHWVSKLNKSGFDVMLQATTSSSNFVEKANTVLKNNGEAGNSEFSHDRDLPPRVTNGPQEPRPGLGNRKRARFSMRETTSQSHVAGGMSLDIEKLGDPEEYFSVCDIIQRAQKELQRQTGEVSTDSTQLNLTTVVRKNRPGLLGHDRRKTVHQDRFASVVADVDEELLMQKPLSRVENISQSISTSIVTSTDTNNVSQEKKPNGDRRNSGAHDSAAKEKSKVGDLLDQFLSQDSANLDDEFMQKRLGVGTICVDNLYMENIDSVRKSDNMVIAEPLPRPIKPLSNIQNVKKKGKGKGSARAQKPSLSSAYSVDSPTPPRYPFSSLDVSAADLPGNPLSFAGIDGLSPTKDSFYVAGTEKEGSLVDCTGKPAGDNVAGSTLSDESASVAKQKNHADSMPLDNLVSDITANLLGPSGDKSNHLDLNLNEPYKVMYDKAEEMQQPEVLGKEDTHSNIESDKLVKDSVHSRNLVDDNSTKSSNRMDLDINGCHSGLMDEVEETQQPETMEHDLHEYGNHMENEVEDVQAVGFKQVEPSCEGFNNENFNQFDTQNDPSVGQSENEVRLPEQNNSKVTPEASRESLNVGSKQKQVSKRKSLAGESSVTVERPQKKVAKKGHVRETQRVSRRKSLVGAGTEWKAGVRRSTRMRMEPLKYWKGERLLYGRVHDSLVTVVGCEKCTSPSGNNGGPKLKVIKYEDLMSMAKV